MLVKDRMTTQDPILIANANVVDEHGCENLVS